MAGEGNMLGSCSGCIAGLVAITPAAGTVGPIGALVIGIIALASSGFGGCGS